MKLYPKVLLFIMPETNCAFLQWGVARHHVSLGIFKLPNRKAYVTMKKDIIQIIEKYRVVDKNFNERLELGNAYVCELHYKKDDIKFTSNPKN